MDEGIVQIVEGSERKEVRVLILVVVEDGLVLPNGVKCTSCAVRVLILVVVENGLVRMKKIESFDPCAFSILTGPTILCASESPVYNL